MITLWPHQQEARTALNAFYAKGGMSGGVSLPTGTGKTRVMVSQANDEALDYSDPRRVAVVVDRDILVEQTEAELRKRLDPSISVGVVKAHRNELGARVLVISIHTMRSAKRLKQIPPVKVAIVDEAHMSVSPTYKAFFEHIGANQPGGARLSGFSATWTRSDGTGLGDVWQEVVYTKSINWAIGQGILVKPRAIQLGEGVDLSEVRTMGKDGDYRDSDLGKAVMLEELRDTMVAGVLKHGLGRPGVLFAPTVESAEYFGDGLRSVGVPTEGVYGSTPSGERKARHIRHRRGATAILTTCTALAVGWDEPFASLGILLRPIRHEGLFVQITGRLLRKCPGCAGAPDVHLSPCRKTDALLLDCVRATDEVRLRNAIDLSTTVHRVVDDELEEVVPTEPVTRERIVQRRRGSYEVEIVAGASVKWLQGPAGIPFVPIGDREIVFVIEDVDGFRVCHHTGKRSGLDGNPLGQFETPGMTYEDAVDYAAMLAEDIGAARFARYAPSYDERAVKNARWVLGYFARWSASRLASAPRIATPFGPALVGHR